MKNWKRFAALGLSGAMLLSLAGCGNQGSEETSKSQSKAENTAASSESAAQPSDKPENELSWLNTSGDLPIVEEGTKKTLSMYIRMNADAPAPEEIWLYDFIEQAMNIDIEVTKFTDSNASEVLSLAFASGDLPDMIIGGGFSTADLVKYGAVEEQIIDLAPYINETYMPKLSAIFEEKPEYKTPFTDADGKVWSLGFITAADDREQVSRVFLNYDWLEECNLEVPETLDEFTEALRAFKNLGDDIVPLGGSYIYNNPMNYILNAFGYVTNSPNGLEIALRNGKVVLPVADREAYGDFLTYMNMLYTEGLIHPDFFTMDSSTTTAVMSEGRNGFFSQAPFVFTDDFNEWWGALPLTSDWNDTAQWPIMNSAVKFGQAVVTSACEEPELAAAFMDWFFDTAEGSYYEDESMSGVDWTSYELSTVGPLASGNSDYLLGISGAKAYADNEWTISHIDQVENPNEYNSNADYIQKKIQLWNYFVLGTNLTTDYSQVKRNSNPSTFDISTYDNPADAREDITSGQAHFELALQETVCKYSTSEVFPSSVYFDADTQTELSNLLVVINDYAKNETAKFITGARSLDELNDYFDEIERLGALDYVKAYADYYETVK